MKFRELTILLPCHSLEDFPLHHEGEEAEGLLAAWTALWHPALLATAGRMPGWSRADSPPEDLAERLLIVPQVSESLLLAGWPARVKSEGGHIIRKLNRRPEIVANALAELDGQVDISPDRVADFFALGLAYLQVELLTRQMRYMSNIDEVHFQAEVLRAAEAAVAHDEETAQKHLVSCFEVLTEARERFYSAEAYLLDLTLVAPTTLNASLRAELAAPVPVNLLATAQTIEQLAAQDASLLADVAAALRDRKAALIGGDYLERETPLLPPESILRELQRGLEIYQQHLGERPKVYGRRRFGLTPVLPQILARLGFLGALHATLEDGQFPRGDQSKLRWGGTDSSAIDALTRIPLDASRAESFLSFPTKLGETMDLDHVATVVFAHWPGQASTWYHDLRRICSFAPVMGRFITLTDYFEQTEMSGRLARFEADQYRAPYLKQSVIRKQGDPLSRSANHQRRQLAAEQEHTLRTIVKLLRPTAKTEATDWLERVETASRSETPDATIDDSLPTALAETASEFAAALPRSDEPKSAGILLCNPFSFARKACVELPAGIAAPAVGGHVLAAQQRAENACAVVEVPAMGYAWIKPGAEPAPQPTSTGGGWLAGLLGAKQQGTKPMAEDTMLRNEHLEVRIDPATGGIRAVHDFHTRGNRLSQQLGFRLPGVRPKPGDVWHDPDLEASYAVMVGESLEITSAGPALAEMVTHGKLVDPEDGRKVAGFRQTFQLWRGSPVLLIDIELDIVEEPRADAWNSYYAARFAWNDEAADLYRSVGWGVQSTDAKRLEAPLFVEARTEKTRTTILTGGLPYHRRIGLRMLDSLLVVRGESQRRFRLGVGFELAYPLPAALELLAPPVVVSETAAPPKPVTSWLFHVDARNLVATHWEPLEQEGRMAGFRVRLLETEGRAGRAMLRAFKNIASARQPDFHGQTLAELPIDNGSVRLDFTAHEWVEVEAVWA